MWVVVHHNAYDGSGAVGAALRRHRLAATHVRPYLGDAVPTVAALSGVIVLGGPSGAADDDTPHLRAERALLADAARAGLPVLGICFGAQLLAVALGGGVHRAPRPSVGIGAVELTADGVEDPVVGPAGPRPTVLRWHHDHFDAPPGSTTLATDSEGAPQAFRWGAGAYGLQFHVELDHELAETIRPQLLDVPLAATDVDDATAAGARVLDAFFGGSPAAPVRPGE